MAYSVKKGSFATNTSISDQAITGVGFQPKAVIFFWTYQTASGMVDGMNAGVGFATSTSESHCNTFASNDNVTERTGRRQNVSSSILFITGGDQTLAGGATLKTLDTDGFTITWGTAPSQANIVHYIALGGTDLTNAKVGQLTGNGASGSQAVTGVGFQPDLLLFLFSAQTGTATANSIRFCLGAATSATDRVASCIAHNNNQAATVVASGQRSDACILGSSLSTINLEGDLVSMDSDGFTIDWQVGTTTNTVGYLALKGGRYGVGIGQSGDGTGTQTESYMMKVDPDGLMMYGINLATLGGMDLNNLNMSIGGTDGSTAGDIWFGSTDNVATANTKSYSHTTEIYSQADPSLSLPRSTATLDSFTTEGASLNWNNGLTNETAREFIYVGFGQPASYSRSGSESLAISESLARTYDSIRASTETMAISESLARTYGALRDISETLAVSESLERSYGASRSFSETLALADDVASQRDYARSVADTLNLSDSLLFQLSYMRALAETLAIDDSLAHQLTREIFVVDSLAIADSLARSLTSTRDSVDTLSITESLDVLAGYVRDVQDSISISDSVIRQTDYGVSFTESLSISDSVERNYAMSRNIVDILSISDSLEQSLDYIRLLTDEFEFSELVLAESVLSRDVVDVLALSDLVTYNKDVTLINLTDSLAISDSPTRSANYIRSVIETLSLSDVAIFPATGIIIGKIGRRSLLSTKTRSKLDKIFSRSRL